MRKFTAFATVLFSFVFAVPAIAEEEISILIDKVPLVSDQPPVIKNDRTLVPMRAIFEALGAEIIWDDSTKTVTAVDKNNQVISLTVGDTEMLINGTEKREMDTAPRIIAARTMVPLRAVGEVFGCEVLWDAQTRTVSIETEPSEEKKQEEQEPEALKPEEPKKEDQTSEETVFQGQKDSQVIETSIAKIRNSYLEGASDTVDALVKKLCPKERKWYGVKDSAGYLYVNFEGTADKTTLLMQFTIYSDGSVKLTSCQAGGADISPEIFVETFFE